MDRQWREKLRFGLTTNVRHHCMLSAFAELLLRAKLFSFCEEVDINYNLVNDQFRKSIDLRNCSCIQRKRCRDSSSISLTVTSSETLSTLRIESSNAPKLFSHLSSAVPKLAVVTFSEYHPHNSLRNLLWAPGSMPSIQVLF